MITLYGTYANTHLVGAREYVCRVFQDRMRPDIYINGIGQTVDIFDGDVLMMLGNGTWYALYRMPGLNPIKETMRMIATDSGQDGEPVVKDSLTTEMSTEDRKALDKFTWSELEKVGEIELVRDVTDEVGTPRVDSYTHYLVRGEWTVSRDLARQLERELICSNNRREELRNRNQELQHLAVGHQIAQEAALENSDDNLRRLMAAEKERDEWRDLAGKMAYKPAHWTECLCVKCEDWRKALAAYELKAKEGA